MPRYLVSIFVVLALTACTAAPPAAAPTAAPAAPAAPTAAPQAPAAAAAPTSAPTAAPVSAPTSAPQAAQQPVKIKGMTQLLSTDAALLIAKEKGYFAEQGLDVDLQVINDGATAIPLLSTGQLDFAVGAVGVALFNAISRGTNIRIVGDKGEVAPDPSTGFSSLNWFVVAKAEENNIKGVKDLKGKKIAISDPNSVQALTLEQLLQTGGLTTSDVDVVRLGFPDMVAALGNHAVDAALANEPFAAQGVANGSLVEIFNTATIRPGDQSAVILFGPSIDKLGADVGNRWMVAYTRGIRTYLDAFGPKKKDRDEIVNILANTTTVKDKALYDRMGYPYFNPNCTFNITTVREVENWYVDKGLMDQKPDLDKAVDTSYCEHAVAVLGPYS
jgi:NitT/TauT family transport system substrate-binding protein